MGCRKRRYGSRGIERARDDVGEKHGREAVPRYLHDWIDAFDDVTNVPEELLDVGDDRVLAVHHASPLLGSGLERRCRRRVHDDLPVDTHDERNGQGPTRP